MSKIRAIHPFGPPVGKFTFHATVAQTIARERKRLKELADAQKAANDEAETKVRKIAK